MKSKFRKGQSQLFAGRLRVKAFCSFLKRLWRFRTPESQNSHAASPGPSPQPCLQSTGEVGDVRARGGRREMWEVRKGDPVPPKRKRTKPRNPSQSYQDKLRAPSSAPFDSSAGRAEDCRRLSAAILRVTFTLTRLREIPQLLL
ncbi:unnamed protein product [Rangifer tarandus platyrhynchus]|uniref:Uncharacterized protein n=2 Tax=Rangifer tarandus platyrhynchus TaxID=3082113 RepID=A0ACB0DXH5_RANTA|nr:unnamed protein product [Rangifer tarandus platyrhynchus]CAI9692893.1 unnamed protein product [Rangifer tarandus platyrhynchus]